MLRLPPTVGYAPPGCEVVYTPSTPSQGAVSHGIISYPIGAVAPAFASVQFPAAINQAAPFQNPATLQVAPGRGGMLGPMKYSPVVIAQYPPGSQPVQRVSHGSLQPQRHSSPMLLQDRSQVPSAEQSSFGRFQVPVGPPGEHQTTARTQPPVVPPAESPSIERTQAPVAPPAGNQVPQLDAKEQAVEQVLATAPIPCRIKRYQFKPGLPLGAVGKGAFGLVYRAKRRQSDDEIAIKMIENASSQMHLLSREIDIMRGLSHPSIVNMLDVFRVTAFDWMFIVMEFVQGGDLLARLTQEPHLFDECLTRALFFHISCALAYAHVQGILHRDIKPENVLLCADGFPKLADFGMSKNVREGDWGKTEAGTPFYKAPEVSKNISAIYAFPADVFSAGNLLLDILHDRVCMEGVFHLMPEHEKQRFTKQWKDSIRPQFSDDVKNIQKRMVNQLPGNRGSMHQTCMELLDLAERDPKPHHFWSRQTILPQGPPEQKVPSPEEAAEIAGRLGYALNCGVKILIHDQWFPGYVKVISESVCPGALSICYKDANKELQEVLVCPWHFELLLRPDPKAIEEFTSVAQTSLVGEKPALTEVPTKSSSEARTLDKPRPPCRCCTTM